MSWTVVYSAQAKQDLRNIFEYIAHSLCSPDAAKSQTRRIMAEIHSLDEMPLRYLDSMMMNHGAARDCVFFR